MPHPDLLAAIDALEKKLVTLEKNVDALEGRRRIHTSALPQIDLFGSPALHKPTIDTGLMARKLDAVISNVEAVLKA